MTTCMSCSTIRIVRFWAIERTSAIVSWVSAALMPAVGSSRQSSRGSVAKAMPTSRLRCSPWERLAASSYALSERPIAASTASAFSMMSRYPRWWAKRLHPCRRDWAAIRTFSSVVALGRMLVIWYERAIPRCEIRSGESPVMSPPSNRMRPEDGRKTPVRQLKKVLLPAPFAPMTARISSRASSKFIWFSAVSPPNRTVRSSVRRIGTAAGPPKEGAAVTYNAFGSCAVDICSSGRREFASWREYGLFLWHHFDDPVFAVVDLENEFAQEGLVVFLAQRFVALREIIPFLHLQAFECRDQFGCVVAALEARLLDAELQRVHRLEVGLNITIGDRRGRVDGLEPGHGLIEEPLVPRRVERRFEQRHIPVDADKPFDLVAERGQVRRLRHGTVAGKFVFSGQAQIVGLVADRHPVLAK